MLSFEKGHLRFDTSRCTQCGGCLASCRYGALALSSCPDGTFRIDWAADACTHCNLCVRTCPAGELIHRPLRDADWDTCSGSWLGRARDRQLCFQGSSGGVARALIRHCLNTGYYDAAWCVIRDAAGNIRGSLLRHGDDLACIANSEYRPIPALAGLPRLPRGTRLLLVGTNCQIQAARRFFQGSGVHLTLVAIFCKQQKTLVFTRFVNRILAVPSTAQAQYRGNGWPGEIRSGNSRVQFASVASLPFGKGLWRVLGCRVCPNPLGHDADLTLADPWGIIQERNGDPGATLTIVRTAEGQALLEHSASDIEFEPLGIEAARKSVDWGGIKKKQARQSFYLQESIPFNRRLMYSLGEFQRKTYEFLLERVRVPELLLRILNRLPFLG